MKAVAHALLVAIPTSIQMACVKAVQLGHMRLPAPRHVQFASLASTTTMLTRARHALIVRLGVFQRPLLSAPPVQWERFRMVGRLVLRTAPTA